MDLEIESIYGHQKDEVFESSSTSPIIIEDYKRKRKRIEEVNSHELCSGTLKCFKCWSKIKNPRSHRFQGQHGASTSALIKCDNLVEIIDLTDYTRAEFNKSKLNERMFANNNEVQIVEIFEKNKMGKGSEEDIAYQSNSEKRVQQLYRKLETAISDGDEVSAVDVVKILTKLKVHCLIRTLPLTKSTNGMSTETVTIDDQDTLGSKIMKIKRDVGSLTIMDEEDEIRISDKSNLFLALVSTVGETEHRNAAENPANTPTTSELIRQHQYDELMNLDKQDLVKNVDEFECPICNRNCPPQEGAILRGCLHTFCSKCLCNIVTFSIEAEVKCPYKNNQYSCDNVLLDREVKGLVDKDTYEQHLAKSLLIAENTLKNTFHCKTPDCAGWCIYEQEDLVFECPVCLKVNCLTCRAIHNSISCAKYQEQLISDIDRDRKITYKRQYDELMNLDNLDLVKTVEEFECPICITNYPPGEGVILRDCLHTFCRECLCNTITFCEEAEVKCPYNDDQYSCESLLQDREIKVLVDEAAYEKHLAKSLSIAEKKLENTFHCKTPDCMGWCIYEDDVNMFECPVCKTLNCLTCQAIHEAIDCRQYQDQLKRGSAINASELQTKQVLEEMLSKREAMECPTCQIILMKKWGCDWLKCTMCGTEICWATRGPRWGPSGKGDLSGGCQCRVNGVRCHPNCGYCH